MEVPGFTSVFNASMALEAIDPFEDVCAVLESPVLAFLLQPENLRASPDRTGKGYEGDDGDEPAGHFFGHSA